MNTGIDEMLKQRDDERQRLKDIEEEQKSTQLRSIKLEAFRLAVQIRPSIYTDRLGQSSNNSYSAASLIKDAELIYQSLLNK